MRLVFRAQLVVSMLFAALAAYCTDAVAANISAAVEPVIGGLLGSTFIEHGRSDVWRFSEDPAIRFSRPFNLGSGYRLTIYPETPHTVQYPPYVAPQSAGLAPETFQIRMRMRPNQRYSISLEGLYDYSGRSFPAVSFQVSTPPAPVPEKPTTHRSPDFFCALAHSDWVHSTPDGEDAATSFASETGTMLVGAAVRCARFGPIPLLLATLPDPKLWDWRVVDGAIEGARRFGIVPNPFVLDAQNAPSWAAGGGISNRDTGSAFATAGLYSHYVSALVLHVHDKFPQIRKFECGVNEPNAPENFNNSSWNVAEGSDDGKATRLASFLLACYSAVHAVDPAYEVDAPGVESGVPSYDYLSFLDKLYGAGCGYRKCWDVLTMHEYPWIDPAASVDTRRLSDLYGKGKGPSLALSYKLFQSQARKAESAGHTGITEFPVAITETGFSSDSNSFNGLDESVQAAYMAKFLNLLAADRSVRFVVWSDIEHSYDGLFGDDSLYRADRTRKPAWAVWRTFASY